MAGPNIPDLNVTIPRPGIPFLPDPLGIERKATQIHDFFNPFIKFSDGDETNPVEQIASMDINELVQVVNSLTPEDRAALDPEIAAAIETRLDAEAPVASGLGDDTFEDPFLDGDIGGIGNAIDIDPTGTPVETPAGHLRGAGSKPTRPQ